MLDISQLRERVASIYVIDGLRRVWLGQVVDHLTKSLLPTLQVGRLVHGQRLDRLRHQQRDRRRLVQLPQCLEGRHWRCQLTDIFFLSLKDIIGTLARTRARFVLFIGIPVERNEGQGSLLDAGSAHVGSVLIVRSLQLVDVEVKCWYHVRYGRCVRPVVTLY